MRPKFRVCINLLIFMIMSEENITTPGTESHQLQASAPDLDGKVL